MKLFMLSLAIVLVLMYVQKTQAFKLKKYKKAAFAYMLLQASKPKLEPTMDMMMMMNGESFCSARSVAFVQAWDNNYWCYM